MSGSRSRLGGTSGFPHRTSCVLRRMRKQPCTSTASTRSFRAQDFTSANSGGSLIGHADSFAERPFSFRPISIHFRIHFRIKVL